MDLLTETPEGTFDVIVCAGVLVFLHGPRKRACAIGSSKPWSPEALSFSNTLATRLQGK